MFKKVFITSALLLISSTHNSHAQETAKPAIMSSTSAQNCKMVETSQVGINFNNPLTDFKTARTFIDDKMNEIKVIAADLAIENLEVQSLNYNVYSNSNYSGCGAAPANIPQTIQLSGSIAFNITDSSKASALMEKLGEKGYNVNFNLSSYRQCQ